VLFRFPPHTRIMVIPSDDGRTQEYAISRRLLVSLSVLLVVLSILFVLVVLSYTSLTQQAREVPELKRQLVAARAELVSVQELNSEMEEMRDLQERLLTLLGIAPADSVGSGISARLGEVAGVIMTPPPDVWPVLGYVTMEFDEGNIPNGQTPHGGIDLVAPLHAPVVSAGRGIVQQAGWDESLGNYVEIRHGFGYVTVYGHCSTLEVRAGDRVDAGQQVGTLGGTGQVTAPHLHFEVWKDGEAMDPRLVIPGEPGEAGA
jgi:murein DD-endopeptidase MepM/ murein hydrolase activator NlpD